MDYPENPNPNPNPNSYVYFPDNNIVDYQSSEFEISDYLIFDDDDQGFDHHEDSNSSQSMVSTEKMILDRSSNGSTSENSNIKCKKKKMEVGQRVAFRTKSQIEIMDDGFKWRKYGKKSIKNSPNLRNYYKCSTEGCPVRKTVERDREDSKYVITAYKEIHNHESPCHVYDYNYNNYNYNHHDDHHQTAQNCWTLQPPSSPPSSSSS